VPFVTPADVTVSVSPVRHCPFVAAAEPVAALTAADALLTASVPSGVAHPSAPLTSVTTDAQLLDAASMRFHRTHSTCPPAEANIVTVLASVASVRSALEILRT